MHALFPLSRAEDDLVLVVAVALFAAREGSWIVVQFKAAGIVALQGDACAAGEVHGQVEAVNQRDIVVPWRHHRCLC